MAGAEAHESSIALGERPTRKAGIGAGVLYPERQPALFSLERFYPSAALAEVVDHYWMVSWALPEGERREQETLPDPCSHVAFEDGGSEIVAPMRGRFHRELVGRRAVYAIKFLPAGMHALTGVHQAGLVNTRPPVANAFTSLDVAAVEADIVAAKSPEAFAADMDTYLRGLAPQVTDLTRLANGVVARVMAREAGDPIETVEAMAEFANRSVRSLQRLFASHIGLSPKWVIQRARLHDALGVLRGNPRDLTAAAHTLGYSDQAHFARDFRAVVGVPPSVYAGILTESKTSA